MKIQGKYETNNGELTISKNGDQYNGIYAQNGVISGKLSENKLEGQWSNNGLEGLFLFEFSEDGAFSGKYKKGLDPGNMRGKWTGKLVSAVSAVEELKAEEPVTEKEDFVMGEDCYGTQQKEYWESDTLVKTIQGDGTYELTNTGSFDEYKELVKGKCEMQYFDNYVFTEEQIKYIYEEGEFEDRMLIKGTRLLLDNIKEEGEFYGGWFFKSGKRTYPDGTIMEGIFEGETDFEGTLTKPDGTILKGKFENGELIESLEIEKLDKEEKPQKESHSVKQDSNHSVKYDNGDSYEGSMKDEKRHGKGKYTWADGDIYEGDFVEGKGRTGKGKYTWADGDIYEGDFVEGKRTGKGVFKYADGDYKDGLWENGDFISGKVKLTNKHGYNYIGDYLNDERHGMGKLYDPEGELMYDGKFINGEFEGNLKKNLETLKSAILEFAKANGFYNSLTASFLKLFKTDDDNPGELYEKGVDLYHNKKYEDSIETFVKLVLKSNTDYISSENTELTSSVDFILSNAQKLAPDEIYIKLDYELEFNDYYKSYFSLIDKVYNLFKEINNRSINYYKVWRIYREYKYFMKTDRGSIIDRGPEEKGGVFNTLYGSDLKKIENYLNEMNKIEIKHEWFINELERLNKVLIKSKNTLKQRKGKHDENERKRNAENDRRREADRKQREEQKKREIEARKNSCRFEITYAVKLKEDASFGNSLMAKIEAQQQGKGFLEALSTADGKGGYRERSIRVTHDTNSLSNGAAKDYVARNDRDVQKGVAGSSTIKIIRIDQL